MNAKILQLAEMLFFTISSAYTMCSSFIRMDKHETEDSIYFVCFPEKKKKKVAF